MWNTLRGSGVYLHMLRALLIVAGSSMVLAQPSPQVDPLDAALRAASQWRDSEHWQENAVRREEARDLLRRAPADSPRFLSWAQQLASTYQAAGMSAQARMVLQEAQSRAAALGTTHPSNIGLLEALGESWRQDGNLLKAAAYLEQAATAQAAAPPRPAPKGGVQLYAVIGDRFASRNSLGASGNTVNLYNRLADVYQQLGRPDAVAAVASKVKTLVSADPYALARFYEQHQQLDEAAAIYKKMTETPTDGQAAANAWQSLANLDARQERYSDAVDAMQKAVTSMQSSSDPGSQNQASWMRSTLAGYLRSAGQLDQADHLYQQLVQESQGQPQAQQAIAMYAQYLAETNRGAQGEAMLKQYLESNPGLEPPQKGNAYFQLANVARRMGNAKAAEEYQGKGQSLQPPPPPPPAAGPRLSISEDLEAAQKAANTQHADDAFRLAMRALDQSAQATDGEQIDWRIPGIARTLAVNKEPARAEQLFQRLIALAKASSAYTERPLISAGQNYARFLMNQKDRHGDVPGAIEWYRGILEDANGPDSGTLVEAFRLKLEFAQFQSQWEAADTAAQELLKAQESVSGNTSEPYLNDLQAAARAYEAARDFARALPLRRKAQAIVGLVAPPDRRGDWRRNQTRMDTAMVLAHLGQFDEAEALAAEALQDQARQTIPSPPLYQYLEQIRAIKKAGEKK